MLLHLSLAALPESEVILHGCHVWSALLQNMGAGSESQTLIPLTFLEKGVKSAASNKVT